MRKMQEDGVCEVEDVIPLFSHNVDAILTRSNKTAIEQLTSAADQNRNHNNTTRQTTCYYCGGVLIQYE
jgi:hypothetical protein